MTGRRQFQVRLPPLPELRSVGAIWMRALADRLVGPVERWCPICELELELDALPAQHRLPLDDE